jgi:3-methylfumaryl-CoA hydratase
MFGGLRLRPFRPIRIGDPIERISTLQDLQFKRSSAGTMCVASVVHHITSGGELALEETWTTLFLPGRSVDADAAARGAQPKPGRTIADVGRWTRLIHPDPVLLFRYSALTFNSHLIHFDTQYALEEERYPALLVQGPLLANLLLDFACEHNPDRALLSYSMRAVAPLFANAPFEISALPTSDTACAVWATGPDGATASTAEVTFA